MGDLLAVKPTLVDKPQARAAEPFQRDIVFDKVGFWYGEDSGFRMENVDLAIAKGSFVGIVGASGSGKSTMLNLLLRFYDPSAGSLRFDGVDARDFTQESLRAQMGVVFQENFLFNASIIENIRLGKPDASYEEVVAAAKAAEVDETIRGFPDGYDTNVGERGGKLSGGQRQRVAIARALVRDPALLILDEATSALDAVTEAKLNETLARIAKTRTVVSVTHRLGSVEGADHILLLDHGEVVEQGGHDQLMALDGLYAALWRKQRIRQEAAAAPKPETMPDADGEEDGEEDA
jgi:ATP-binding cassette subfamily B protein